MKKSVKKALKEKLGKMVEPAKNVKKMIHDIDYGIMERVYERFDIPYTLKDSIPLIDYTQWEKDYMMIGQMNEIANHVKKLVYLNIAKVQNLDVRDGVLIMEVREFNPDGSEYYREVYRY